MRYLSLVAAPVLLLAIARPALAQGALFPDAQNGVAPTSLSGPPIRMGRAYHLRPLHRRASYARRASRHHSMAGQQGN